MQISINDSTVSKPACQLAAALDNICFPSPYHLQQQYQQLFGDHAAEEEIEEVEAKAEAEEKSEKILASRPFKMRMGALEGFQALASMLLPNEQKDIVLQHWQKAVSDINNHMHFDLS